MLLVSSSEGIDIQTISRQILIWTYLNRTILSSSMRGEFLKLNHNHESNMEEEVLNQAEEARLNF